MAKQRRTPGARDVLNTYLRILSDQAKKIEKTGSSTLTVDQALILSKLIEAAVKIQGSTQKADKDAKKNLANLTVEELEALVDESKPEAKQEEPVES
jgi:hypothetical protein